MEDRIRIKRYQKSDGAAAPNLFQGHSNESSAASAVLPIHRQIAPSKLHSKNSTEIQHPPVGHDFSKISITPVQAKLTLSQPDDPAQQEADRVAAQVMGISC